MDECGSAASNALMSEVEDFWRPSQPVLSQAIDPGW